jgi:hypothetical protein
MAGGGVWDIVYPSFENEVCCHGSIDETRLLVLPSVTVILCTSAVETRGLFCTPRISDKGERNIGAESDAEEAALAAFAESGIANDVDVGAAESWLLEDFEQMLSAEQLRRSAASSTRLVKLENEFPAFFSNDNSRSSGGRVLTATYPGWR